MHPFRFQILTSPQPTRCVETALAQHWATLDIVLTYDFPRCWSGTSTTNQTKRFAPVGA